MRNKNLICTICARSGSKGIKNKNLQLINGLTLLEITIIQAKKSKLFSKIIVSSDSKRVLQIAKNYDVDFVINRSSKLSGDKVSKIDVIKDAVNKTETYFNFIASSVMDIDLTTPLRTVKDIQSAYSLFLKNNFNNLLSVCESKKNPYFNLLESKNNKTQLIKRNNIYNSRQVAPKVYEANSALYIWKRDFLFKASKIIYSKTGVYIMPRHRSIDIDDKLDLYMVKSIYNKNN